MKQEFPFELSINQQKVLDAFLKKGTLSTGDLTKITGISRPNCYDILNRLIEKGLITKIVENKQVQYTINKLDYKSVLDQKKEELSSLQKTINEYNDKITQIKQTNKNKPFVEIYSGTKGLQKFFKRSINSKKISVFGAEGILEEKYPHIWRIWIRILKEKNIKFRVIYTENNREHRKQFLLPIIKTRYINRENFTNVTTQIRDTEVNLFHWHDIPLIISIQNPEIAKAYEKEFNQMWKNAKK